MLIKEDKVPKDISLRILFLVRIRKNHHNFCRLYEYRFTDDININSIKFVKATEYKIKEI